MNDADFSELIDKAMAGRLTPEEEIRWSGLLAERPELEEDLVVGRALQGLPPPPVVSSNFTARVLEEIRLGERAGAREERRGFARSLRWPKLRHVTAVATLAAVLVFAGLELRQQQASKDLELKVAAKTFAGGVNKVAEGKAPEAVVAVFQDFDAIRNLPEPEEAVDSKSVDYKLLTALEK